MDPKKLAANMIPSIKSSGSHGPGTDKKTEQLLIIQKVFINEQEPTCFTCYYKQLKSTCTIKKKVELGPQLTVDICWESSQVSSKLNKKIGVNTF